MQLGAVTEPRRILRTVGSLWFAAVLLVLLLVAMACATVFESTHGTEQALRIFYKSRWFTALLALLGVNVLAALLLRYPYSKKQVGFVITHLSILIILLGAMVTERIGVNGRIAIAEGQTVDSFRGEAETLSIKNRSTGEERSVRLTSRAFGGLAAVDKPKAPSLTFGDLTATIERYIPDSDSVERVANTNPHPQPAVELVLSHAGREDSGWAFAGQGARLGPLPVEFRIVADQAELTRLLEDAPSETSTSKGTVKIELAGATYEFPLEDCTDQPVPIGDTGRTVRVLRYFPHATVVEGGKLMNASDRPENPAIEAELTGPEGTVARRAFANFPDFSSMHGKGGEEDVKLTFMAGPQAHPDAPIAVFLGPGEDLHVRFAPRDGNAISRTVSVGESIPTPWPDRTFTVRQRYDHARVGFSVEPVIPPRETRVPAILVRIDKPDSTSSRWIRKFDSRQVAAGGVSHEVAYGDEVIPLGFKMTLRRFRIEPYPGETRPRSFESHITITDTATGREQSRVISMNHPVEHAGYSMFQSNYRLPGMGSQRTFSILSVARDPGLPIVFAGYIGTMAGMLIILGTRFMDDRRRRRGRS